MIIKIAIYLLMIAMIVALGYALYHLISPNRDETKLAKALTGRIVIWIALLALIVIATQLKWLSPSESLLPTQAPATKTAD